MKFILILWVINTNSGAASASLTQEFTSWNTCEAARMHTTQSINKSTYHKIISQGCFAK